MDCPTKFLFDFDFFFFFVKVDLYILYTHCMAWKLWSLNKCEKELYSFILSSTGVKIQNRMSWPALFLWVCPKYQRRPTLGLRSRFQHWCCMLLCRPWIAVRLLESMVYQLSFIKRFGQCWVEICCLCFELQEGLKINKELVPCLTVVLRFKAPL